MFDPLEHKAVIDFKLGPSGLKLSEALQQSEECPSIGQLFIIFTDVRNLCASTVKDNISLVEEPFEDDDKDREDNVRPESPRFGDVLPSPTRLINEDGLRMADSMVGLGESAQVHDPTSPLKQSPASGMEIDFASLEKFTLDEIIQLFRYRVKNNSLGNIHYLPSKWNGTL